MNVREELNLLAPRLRRYARALIAGHPGPSETADGVVSVALRRAFDTGAPSLNAPELQVLAYTLLIEANREQFRTLGPQKPSFGSPSPGRTLGSSSCASLGANAIGKTGGSYAADLHSPEKLQSAFDSHDDLTGALCALKLEEREALLLVSLEGFSYAQAARILKISRPVLIARLSRARERMPKNLKDRSSHRRTKGRPTHLRIVK